ncbi:E3 ubiquitin-protein ligase TRIM56 [Holothuria leucospilota]|uniref:E3 ubiquitin-protein ligase TRIM56 n=1 Tax=Holothuria leucospilota TaxID=206669 RepID=A0A9Q1C6H8_HOLLE|nr:E3 ubiquitin-protein ligase TRIM56 [Holothuria leucospilota]
MQGSYDVVKCPECREEIEIPTNGVNGFKTDFYSKSLVEYVQIQQSLKSDEVRECYGCSKYLRVAAYCFKCNDFLCKDCHNFHVTNKMMKDHQKQTLSLEDIGKKNITIDKLASMRDAPRCNTHPEKMSELYCETCRNLPVCMACTYGEHKGHNLHEVKALAKLKKEKLAEQLKEIEETEKSNKAMTPAQAKTKLILNVSTQKETVIKMHDEKDQKIMTEIQNIEERRQQAKQEKQNAEKAAFDSLRREKEKEIEEVKKKYVEIFRVKKIEINDSFLAQENSLEKELAKLRKKRKRFDQDKKELLNSVETQLDENVKIIETLSQHFDNIKKRFQTLHLMSSCILASDNDWSAVQCIPDMCTAATHLMENLKKDFKQLSKLTDVTVNYKQYSLCKQTFTKISENFDKNININNPYSYICGMTGSGDGNIVMSGITSECGVSFIIVIDMNGRVLKEKKLNTQYSKARYCQFLSQRKVASVCEPNEIGLFDVSDGSYIKKNISEVTNSWPKDLNVACVATDPVNNHILVGGYYSRDVYVFDDQLDYLHILTLPEMIEWPRDITVSDGHLLVCDYDGKKCYLTKIDGLESKLVGEFMKPNLEGKRFVGPISVCRDKNGLMYVLWKNYIHFLRYQFYLFQYNHDCSQILTTRKLEGNAKAITVVETSQGEKLLVAAYDTKTVYLYDLMTED